MSSHLIPFSTRSGVVPDYLLGRERAIEAVKSNLDSPLTDENGNLLFLGLRGIGKTVMLTEAGRLAKERGWLVINSYLTEDGLIRRIHQSVNAIERVKHKSHKSIGVNIPGVNFSATQDSEIPELNLSDRLRQLLKTTRAPGILLTVDEVHSTAGRAQEELREYGNEIQLAHREGLPVMSITAGLPGGISSLLKDTNEYNKRTGATFLRRAAKQYLDAIDDEEIWNAYAQAAAVTGKLVAPDILDLLTDAAKGYPYLFQLIGQRVWHTNSAVIDIKTAKAGINSAIRRLGSAVLDTSLADLSALDKSFLLAMAQDDGASKMQDIAARMKISPSQASNYKTRLIEAEMVVGERGFASFTIPYMREHLREYHASTIREATPRRAF